MYLSLILNFSQFTPLNVQITASDHCLCHVMPRILRLLYAYQTENYNFLLFNWEKVTFFKLFVRLLGGSSFRLLFQLTGMKRKWMPFWRLLFHKEYSCKAWEKEHCWKVWPIENIKKKMVDNMSRSVCVFLTFIYWTLAHPVWPDWKCRLRTVEHWEGGLFSG